MSGEDRLAMIRARARRLERSAGIPPTLTAAETREIRAAVLAGQDPRAVAERHGITLTRVVRACRTAVRLKMELEERRAVTIRGIRKICPTCNHPFQDAKSRSGRRVFCSQECRTQDTRRRAQERSAGPLRRPARKENAAPRASQAGRRRAPTLPGNRRRK